MADTVLVLGLLLEVMNSRFPVAVNTIKKKKKLHWQMGLKDEEGPQKQDGRHGR